MKIIHDHPERSRRIEKNKPEEKFEMKNVKWLRTMSLRCSSICVV